MPAISLPLILPLWLEEAKKLDVERAVLDIGLKGASKRRFMFCSAKRAS